MVAARARHHRRGGHLRLLGDRRQARAGDRGLGRCVVPHASEGYTGISIWRRSTRASSRSICASPTSGPISMAAIAGSRRWCVCTKTANGCSMTVRRGSATASSCSRRMVSAIAIRPGPAAGDRQPAGRLQPADHLSRGFGARASRHAAWRLPGGHHQLLGSTPPGTQPANGCAPTSGRPASQRRTTIIDLALHAALVAVGPGATSRTTGKLPGHRPRSAPRCNSPPCGRAPRRRFPLGADAVAFGARHVAEALQESSAASGMATVRVSATVQPAASAAATMTAERRKDMAGAPSETVRSCAAGSPPAGSPGTARSR